MAHSMTGFGRSEANREGISVNTEIKSLNSRYLDVSIHLPDMLSEKEIELKKIVQSYIERGKVHLNTNINTQTVGKPEVTFDENMVEGYMTLLQRLRSAADIEQSVKLSHLLSFENIFTSREEDEETKEIVWDLLTSTTREAMEELVKMRIQEGEQLENDLRNRIEEIDERLVQVKELAENRSPEARDKLHERIKQLVDDESFDEERLEMEVAIIADKIDVTEEIVRLQSHIKFFLEALDQKGAIGRRLNFLAQEMNREINTIGSKANSSEISNHVVYIKENLEKIREQIRNIE